MAGIPVIDVTRDGPGRVHDWVRSPFALRSLQGPIVQCAAERRLRLARTAVRPRFGGLILLVLGIAAELRGASH